MRARAFVPGHVTGFFAPHQPEDPLVAGASGAGLTLATGVHVTVDTAKRGVWLDGERTTFRPVPGVLDAFDADVGVSIETDLPVGAGFGVSGGAALGTALAANAALDGDRSANALVSIAHAAEVTAGTGLGDVVAQARGGIPIRLAPGDPDHGRLDGIPAPSTRVEWLSHWSVSTPDVLAGDVDRVRAAGDRALAGLREEPTLDRLFDESRRFARDAGLLADRAGETIDWVEQNGDRAAMAMLGDTVFAPGRALSDAGFDARATRVHRAGATLRSVDGAVADEGQD